MDILVVGIPGPLFDRARQGISAATGLPVVSVRDPDLLASDPAGAPQRLCFTNHLTLELVQAACERRLKVVSCFDAPEDGAAFYDLPWPKPLRRLSASLFAQAELLGLPDVLRLERREDWPALASHCGVALATPEAWTERPVDSDLRELLKPASLYAREGKAAVISWPRDLLLDGDRPDQPLPRVIELAGPARTLAYGPYLYAAPGPARLRIVLASDCHHAEMAIELHGAALLGRGLFVLDRNGLFAAEIDVEIASAREALEIRLKSERGAIDGRVGVDHVMIWPR